MMRKTRVPLAEDMDADIVYKKGEKMKAKYLLSLLALTMMSCQIGPNYYELPDTRTLPGSRADREVKIEGYHGAHGSAYRASRDACLFVKTEDECTDEEWVEEYQEIPGQGYYDGQWSGSHADELVTLFFFEAPSGRLYIFDDATGEVAYFDFDREVA